MEIPLDTLAGSIGRGSILHSTMFEDIDHGKFFVVIGVSAEHVAGFFYINSRIHPALESKPEQYAMQYPLRKRDYAFLHHDSFLCATSIIKIGRNALAQTVAAGRTQIIDQMHSDHLQELLAALRASRLFSKRDKAQFFY